MARAEPIHGLDPEAPLAVNAALIIQQRLGEMLAFAPYLTDAEAVYELHQMRIAAKRLRYTMELFQEIYALNPDFAARFSAALETVKTLQDHLGFLHDADVLVPQLTAHLTHLLEDSFGTDHRDEPVVGVHFVDFDAGIGLLTLCRETRAERDAAYAKFLTDWVQWQNQELFSQLIALLEEAAHAALSPEPPVAPEAPDTPEPPVAPPVPDTPAPIAEDETAHAQDPVESDKPVRRDAPRRRRPLAPRRAPSSG
jgi:ferritin